MSRRLLSVVTVAACLVAAGTAYAQAVPGDLATPAHISVVQGTAVLERNGLGEAAVENMPLLEGDRLRTETGRLEVLLPDGSVLDLDRNTTLDLLGGGLMRLLGGRIGFIVSSQLEGEARRDYQVDAPAGMIRFIASGEYRVSTIVTSGRPGVDVAVVRGEAVLDADGTSIAVRAGQRTTGTEGQGITSTRAFNSAQADTFYDWADSLRAERVGTRSNAYLPQDLQVYGGTFDRDGTWDNAPEYGGSVWYPRVSADWRPYYEGTWQPYGWGWTFVGDGRWTWPTHHYGRWGHGARGWFWIPAAHWGPAWVSWGLATDYVSWCPLGYDDGPVFGLSFGFSTGSRHSPWTGWTVVPHRSFGRSHLVPAVALRADRLRAVERSAFAVTRTGPTVPGMAVTRRWSEQSGSPYDRAQAVADQRVGVNQGWAATRGDRSMPARPNVAQRSWTDDPGSPYGRAQEVAGERLRQSDLGAAARSRGYDTRPFASPGQTLPYPERFRSTVGPQYRDAPDGAAAPRSQASPRTSPESSQPRAYSGSAPSQTPRAYSSPGPSAVPRSNSTARPSDDRRSYSSRYSAPSPEPRSYSAPSGLSPRSYSAPSAPSPRSYSTPDTRGARPSSSSSPGVSGGRSPGGSSQGVSGAGRSPGGSSQGVSGGRSSSGAPSRGGRR